MFMLRCVTFVLSGHPQKWFGNGQIMESFMAVLIQDTLYRTDLQTSEELITLMEKSAAHNKSDGCVRKFI